MKTKIEFTVEQYQWLEDNIFNAILSICLACASGGLSYKEKEDIITEQEKRLRRLMKGCVVKHDKR